MKKSILAASMSLWAAALTFQAAPADAANALMGSLPTYVSCSQYTSTNPFSCTGYPVEIGNSWYFVGTQFVAFQTTCTGAGCTGTTTVPVDDYVAPGRKRRISYKSCNGQYVVNVSQCNTCS